MATYGWSDLSIQVDATDGGALQEMKTHVRGITVGASERFTEENTTAGSTWVAHVQTGIRQLGDIVLDGVYDDTASTGPNATFNGTHTVTRTVTITWGGSKTTSCECWITSFERVPKAKGKTDYKVTLKPTGTVTEA